jgi:digeranylgeranylglycerophospholipid reductase
LVIKRFKKKEPGVNTLRPLLNNATNKDFDRLLTFMKTLGLRSLIYKTDIDIIKLLSMRVNVLSLGNKNSKPPIKGGN